MDTLREGLLASAKAAEAAAQVGERLFGLTEKEKEGYEKVFKIHLTGVRLDASFLEMILHNYFDYALPSQIIVTEIKPE